MPATSPRRHAAFVLLALVSAGCSAAPTSIPGGKDRPTVAALMKAAAEGQAGQVEQLLKDGLHVNDKDADGQTALMHAAGRGQLGVMKILLDGKALLAEQDKLGQTAVTKAAKNGQRGAILLLKNRHDEKEQQNTAYQLMALRDKEGRTAMMYAAMEGFADIVSDLFHFTQVVDSTDPSQRDAAGKTALMYAAERGHAGVVKVMLTSFPDSVTPAYIALTDKAGKTALQLAEEKGHRDVVALFKK